MTDRQEALQLLRKATNDSSVEFRPGQWEAIDALVNGRKQLLVVQRTGWGKSLVYFIATRMFRDSGRGVTLIISPLLALIRNQVEAASRLGIRAITINSTNRDAWPQLENAVCNDATDALLISPERLANDDFVERVLKDVSERIGLLVVDEVHCISDWGHDFRPDYKHIINVLERMPENMPILGTTATANDRVVADAQAQLGNIGIQRGPLMRKSLALQTLHLPTQTERLAWLADHIETLLGTGIIYTLTRGDAEKVTNWLQEQGIVARAYFSNVRSAEWDDSNAYRQHLEQQLQRNEIKVLVATTALGMGYDKPDLGFVVHYQAPGSIVAYYQQVGRAGRAIDHAIGVLMSGWEDNTIHEYFRRTAFPKEEWVQTILRALEESDGLSVPQLEGQVNLRRGQIEKVLKFLSAELPSPAIKIDRKWRRTAVPYVMDQEHIQRLYEQRQIEWREVQHYMDEEGCLMAFLATALDDPEPAGPCGMCASCLGEPVVEPSYSHEAATEAARFLRHSEFELVCPKQVAPSAFTAYGFRGNLHHSLRAETGRILSKWGDASWGQIVANDKHAGHFCDQLVDAVAAMLNARWHPSPPPEWITCVPSRKHPGLVPDYTRRLANALGLPFKPAIQQVRDKEPQKAQQNRYHQCRNLDGIFSITAALPKGPVLLVDDVIDSGWTLTVNAALLRQSGSGPVWPLALATSNLGM